VCGETRALISFISSSMGQAAAAEKVLLVAGSPQQLCWEVMPRQPGSERRAVVLQLCQAQLIQQQWALERRGNVLYIRPQALPFDCLERSHDGASEPSFKPCLDKQGYWAAHTPFYSSHRHQRRAALHDGLSMSACRPTASLPIFPPIHTSV
jgi:hypothetical protein